MIIFPKWQGRFGNQLFQYAFGRLLHRQTGRAVSFPKAFSIDLWKPENLPGKIYEGEAFDYQIMQWGFDWSMLDRKQPMRLLGFFEDFRYFAPYREEVRSWFPLPALPACIEEEVVVHMRRTDFRLRHSAGVGADRFESTHRQTPPKLLVAAIESFGSGRPVRVLTDDPKDLQVNYLARIFGAQVVCGTPKQDFLTICAAKNVVMSSSTFSWWATFLGNPRRVVCPLWKDSNWLLGLEGNGNFSRPMITDDPRFEYPVGCPICFRYFGDHAYQPNL